MTCVFGWNVTSRTVYKQQQVPAADHWRNYLSCCVSARTGKFSLLLYWIVIFDFLTKEHRRNSSRMAESQSRQCYPPESQCRQNFHQESEARINRQINLELHACYVYQSMAYYFDRDDVALHGFRKYFKDASDEEREHAEKLMKYQNKRGGRVVLQAIPKPDKDEWGSGLEAMEVALGLERTVNQSLLDLHKVADSHGDAQMMDFLETEYLEEQVNAIKELSDHITNLKRVGPGVGEWHYDRKLES